MAIVGEGRGSIVAQGTMRYVWIREAEVDGSGWRMDSRNPCMRLDQHAP